MGLSRCRGLRDPQAASGHEQDGDVEGELLEKGGFTSLHFVADGLEELIGLLRREDVGDGDLFFEPRDIEEGIFLKDAFSDQEPEEAPGDGRATWLTGDRLHGEICPSCGGKRKGLANPNRLHSDADSDQRGEDGLWRGVRHTPGLLDT